LSSSDGDFFSDEEENGDDDEDGDEQFGIEESDSPFAPAELYLSDLIDINNSRGGCGSVHIYIPNDLVYSPEKQDPIHQTKISVKLTSLIAAAEQEPTGLLRELCPPHSIPHSLSLYLRNLISEPQLSSFQ
jgi:hypothetical protein